MKQVQQKKVVKSILQPHDGRGFHREFRKVDNCMSSLLKRKSLQGRPVNGCEEYCFWKLQFAFTVEHLKLYITKTDHAGDLLSLQKFTE